jgi:hypothetical protein
MRLLKIFPLLVAILIISSLFTTGCSISSIGTKGDIRGNITNITKNTEDKNIIGSILMEGNLERDTKYDKASVTITRQTHIFEYNNKKFIKADFESFKIGQKVQALFTGQVLESYPVQVKAIEVVILE